MSHDPSPPLPYRLDDAGDAYAFPVADGSTMIARPTGAIEWWQDGARLGETTLPQDIASAILTSLRLLDDLYRFTCQQIASAEHTGQPEQATMPPEGPNGSAPVSWATDPEQPGNAQIRQGPLFIANGIEVHLLDDGTSWVRRDAGVRAALSMPPDVQKTIARKVGILCYAYAQALRAYAQLTTSSPDEHTS